MTDLFTPMPEPVVEVAKGAEDALTTLLTKAFEAAVEMSPRETAREKESDALSLVSELAAIAGVKLFLLMRLANPLADSAGLWQAVTIDIQKRMLVTLREYEVQGAGETRQ